MCTKRLRQTDCRFDLPPKAKQTCFGVIHKAQRTTRRRVCTRPPLPAPIAMEVHVLGAGQDVGRSCALVSVEDRHILFDCGAHPAFSDERRFPNFSSLPPQVLQDLDVILITHYHFDHAAALPFLTHKYGVKAQIFMTEPTLHLTRHMLLDVCKTSHSRNQHCPFTELDVYECLATVKIIELNKPIRVGRYSDIFVTAYYAGHVLGAVMFYVRTGARSVLYSGDYSMRPDAHLNSAQIPFHLDVDLFITEATYCNMVRSSSRVDGERQLVEALRAAISKRGKILIPITALGRAHAICTTLSAYKHILPLQELPMYITAGTAVKVNALHKRYPSWLAPQVECWVCVKKSALLAASSSSASAAAAATTTPTTTRVSRFADAPCRCAEGCASMVVAALQPFGRQENWQRIHKSGPMLLFATPANMADGISREVFRAWAPEPDNLVVVSNATFSSALATGALRSPETGDVDVRCRQVDLPMSAHADGRDIERMCRHVNAKCVILVHGARDKLLRYCESLTLSLKVECLAPANGDVVTISEATLQGVGAAGLQVGGTMNQMPDNWRHIMAEQSRLSRSHGLIDR